MHRTGSEKRLQIVLKRALDLIVSVSGLILVLPLMAFIALAIKLDSTGPVIYRQRRIGKDGKPFNLLKFRSMVAHGDESEYMRYLAQLIESERDDGAEPLPYRKLGEDPRITRVGRLLRSYYLDELPQIWNILKGEMSLVGPRPHVQFEVDHYTPEQQRRLSARPGATGLWQVRGKSDCTFSELINLDLQYIDQWTLWLDIAIIIETVLIMLRGGEGFWLKVTPHLPALSFTGASTAEGAISQAPVSQSSANEAGN